MIEGVTPASDPKATSAQAVGSRELGKNEFLQLLVAQLEAQDPLSPMDAQDFSAQLAQFSTLEQITNVNSNLEEIKKFESALNNSASLNLIGKQIDSPGNTFQHQSGESRTLNYTLDADATQINIDIFDATGKNVTTLSLASQSAGPNRFAWNGLDSEGLPVKSGAYRFSVSAENSQGNAVNAKTFVQGKVTEVLFEGAEAFAVVDGQKYPVSAISRVGI